MKSGKTNFFLLILTLKGLQIRLWVCLLMSHFYLFIKCFKDFNNNLNLDFLKLISVVYIHCFSFRFTA